MTIEKSLFGTLPDGRKVTRFTVTNGAGLSVSMMDYGCTLLSVDVPDKAGKTVNVILSFDGLAGYLAKPMFAGAVVGRFANRIADGKFTLDGREYQLARANATGNHLHGGAVGFDKVALEGPPVPQGERRGRCASRYTSRDGEEGYPGTLQGRRSATR